MTEAGESMAGADGPEHGWGRARAILDELVDGTRSAALSIVDEQRQRASEQIAGFAGAARAAAQALGGGDGVRSARCAAQSADAIDRLADAVRHRRWDDILGDAENFARRQPRLFMLCAAALGYAAGRVLLKSTEDEDGPTGRAAVARQTQAVAAAVSSGTGNGALVEEARAGSDTHQAG